MEGSPLSEKQQVKDSPGVDTDLPVSRQMETNTYDYYGWNPYWSPDLYMGGYGWRAGGVPPATYWGSLRRADKLAADRRGDDDLRLRNVKAVTGYHIHASDGAMVRSGTLRIPRWKTPTGAFTISSSIPGIGG